MTIRIAYSPKKPSGCMLGLLIRQCYILSLFFLFIQVNAFPQDLPEYDEIAVFLDVPGTGGGEIEAVIRDNELYLPVTDLFNFLKIRNIPSPGLETINGFFINPEATYEITRRDNRIQYQDKIFEIKPGDLIRTETNLYLHTSYYGRIFGLECRFNFRSLSVTVSSKLELPYIREMRQEQMRQNLSRLKGEIKADTNIKRTYPMFKFGMADWSAIATEEINGESETRLNLTLGSMVAGGELTANLYYNSAAPFTEKQQHYLWRYVNNDFRAIRQIMAGKIGTQAISTIYSPVIGIQVTNTPTTYRRSFGSYTLSDMTEPNWIVELYVNNVLVDYVTADASGFFKFEVPLVYGNTIVKLKFYSPWGEERIREQNINIPYNFLPHKTFEYNVGAGIVEDTSMSRFSRARFSYGLTRSLTIGGGAEYLSSITSGQLIPFVNASVRLTNNMLLFGEYAYGVRAKGTFSYRMPSSLQLDLNYTWYDKDQKAINYNFREERKASLAFPLRIGKYNSYQRFSVNQTIMPASEYKIAEWLFSGSLLGVATNLTTYGLFLQEVKPNIYTNLALAFRLPAGFTVMPQTQYSWSGNELITARIRIEKTLLDNAHLSLSYEQNFRNSLKMAELGFRYDFSFAQTGLSVRQTNRITSFVEYARGSLINDRTTRYLGTNNRTNVGRGGISIVPYLDLNANGKKDKGEPKAYGLNIRTNGGRVEKNDRDTTIRILGLEPYTSCFIELDPNSFENIAWRLNKQTISVAVDPNILKLIEVPVIVAGEAMGVVSIEKDGTSSGIGGIIIGFFNGKNKPVGRALTENDGFYSYFGLAPGEYYARIDTAQLRKLNMKADPDTLPFIIAGGMDGDIVEDIDFTLRPEPIDTTVARTEVPSKPVVRKDTSYMIIHEVTQELVTIAEDSWAIQLGAFRKRSNAEAYRRTLHKLLGKDVEIVIEGDYYKVRILDLKTREEVDNNIAILKKNGVTELWVIRLKAKQQQLVLTEKVDTVTKITETYIEAPVPVFSFDMALQVGAFNNESNATRLRDRLTATINKPVIIVPEDGFYKVRITGFENLEEIEKLIPALGFLGHNDLWIPPVTKTEAVTAPAIMPADSIAEVDIEKPQMPLVEEKPVVTEPTFALQVGVYRRKIQALRAQRKIMSKLKLPVDIVEQWGYYHVVITGFFTKEETYRYYPELTGLGYPGISLIENYRKKEE